MITQEAYPPFGIVRNLENAKRKAHLVKWKTTENLDKLLLEFETNIQKKGVKVIWANTKTEAQEAIIDILQKHQIRLVERAESSITAEIELTKLLEGSGVGLAELGNQSDYSFSQTQATAGVSGVDFGIVDTGALAVSSNSPQINRITTLCKVQIALVGIEQLLPNLRDLELFWTLLHSHKAPNENQFARKIIQGPRQEGEVDGPEELIVILIDNGRSKLLAKQEQRQGLYCIGCEACLTVCPVYQISGGQLFGKEYAGPIHSLIAPHTQGMTAFKHLSEASTHCGKCSAVCPVRIDISRMLLLNKRDAVQEGYATATERMHWKGFRLLMESRKRLDFFGRFFKNTIYQWSMGGKQAKFRTLQKVANKSFAAQRTAEIKMDLPQSQFLGVKSKR
jgi:L-lactate dehydrogenase complex protein LldF